MIGGRLMKGAKRCLRLCRMFSCSACSLFGRSFGPSLSTTRQTGSMARLTSALTTRVTSRSCGRSAASLATAFLAIFLSFSLSFPRVASANPVTLTLTVWNLVVTALNALDSRIANNVAVDSADDLQVIASNLQVWTGTASQAQTIAQELERVSGYDIDGGNHINTVYGLTGNGSYDQEQICPDCAGGYVATDHGLEECGTCGGDGMYYWDTVPYLSTHECMLYLASWIRYLSATQTDWNDNSEVAGSGIPEGDYYKVVLRANVNSFPSDAPVSVIYLAQSWWDHVMTDRPSSAHQPYVIAYRNSNTGRYVFGYEFAANFSHTSSSFTGTNLSYISNKSSYAVGNTLYQWGDASASPRYGNEGSTTVPCSPLYAAYRLDVSECPVVHYPSGEVSDSSDGVTWGTDIDWYTDSSDAGAAGGTTVTNEGDTIYNSETNTYVTNNNIDVEPITQRLDVLNAINAQIGIDLRTLNDSMFKELNDLEWWLQKIYYMLSSVNNNLENIRSDMANLDRSTNDLVDLSSLESGVSALSGDIDALLAAVTGSHGADALGVYGRLDTVLNWLDDYAPVDVSGIQAILEDWPDYPVFDDSDLLNAITGSHGSDLLGLFGRLDNVLSWLDSYVAPDLATLNHQLGDFTESDGQTLTVHGLLHWINYYAQDADRAIHDVLTWLDSYVAPDLTTLNHQLGDFTESDGQTLTVHGLLHWINYYAQDADRAIHDVLALGTVTVDGNTYGFADLLYNIWLDLGQFCNDFADYWNGVFGKLDGIVSAIERLDFKTAYPSSPNVPRPTQGDLRERIDWSEWDNAVSTLSHKFPFVIINDIVLIFTALTRPAVTPVFDLPVPNPSDWSSPYLLHVDLSDFDSVAAVMRVGITLWVIARVSRRTLALWTSNEGSAV